MKQTFYSIQALRGLAASLVVIAHIFEHPSHGDPNAMLTSVKREIWSVDRGVAITLTGSLNEYLTRFSYATPRFTLVLLSVFSVVGLVLVAIGVYSVIAYTVSRQTH